MAIDQRAAEQRPGPVSPWNRIDGIDALRGIALAGVLAINLVTEFRVSIFQQFLAVGRPASALDRAVEAFLTVAVDMKAFALFSLLFGVGLAIQFERLAANRRRVALLLRRLITLLLIGLLHLLLIWNGDILVEYALAGLVVLPFLFGRRRLLAGGSLFFLALYLALPLLLPGWVFPSTGAMARNVAEANHIYASGGFFEVLAFRIRELPLILPLHIYVFPRTLGLFLCGALAWRAGILRNPATSDRLLFLIGVSGILFGLTLTLASERGVFAAYQANMAAGLLGIIFLALGYGGAILGVSGLPVGKRLLGWAAPLGRMAFTNYLAQSVIFGWIFYGYGLGLFGHLGATTAIVIGIVVYAGQVVFSAWWLGRYRYGPVEWLWRTLMYGVSQPMSLTSDRTD
jgi:uncharacterized protein